MSHSNPKRVLLAALACLLLLAGIGRTSAPCSNLIVVVVDGMGPAHRQLGELAAKSGLAMNHMEVSGIMMTASADLDITDSAAAATAMFCGSKTYNGVLGYDEELGVLTSVMELAGRRGMNTGIVTTSTLYDATCAAMYAKEFDRSASGNISSQLLKSGIDLLIGGGADYVSKALAKASANSKAPSAFTVHSSLSAFAEKRILPAICLLSEGKMPLAIDAADGLPTLTEMTNEALAALEQDGMPFLLLVESGGIDGASHDNDAASVLREMLSTDEAVAACLKFAADRDDTLVVVAADHETGGLSLGAGVGYRIDVGYLKSVKASSSSMAQMAAVTTGSPVALVEKLSSLPITEGAEIEAALKSQDPAREIGRIVSGRANVSWGTSWHTAVPVTVSAEGPGSGLFEGFFDNSLLFDKIVAALGL